MEANALNSRVGPAMKWVGIITALISFGGALYGLIHSAGELRDHKRVFQEQLKSGQAQQAAGDFAGAWESFTHAEATVADEGSFLEVIGRLKRGTAGGSHGRTGPRDGVVAEQSCAGRNSVLNHRG